MTRRRGHGSPAIRSIHKGKVQKGAPGARFAAECGVAVGPRGLDVGAPMHRLRHHGPVGVVGRDSNTG
eukprot:15551-Eustigmatos_ZCMA.PRE.1